MYTSFFGFRAKPFNSDPELRFHYVTPAYAENFNAIRQGLRSTSRLHILSGTSGTGKTLFLRRLTSATQDRTIFFIEAPSADISFERLVDYICQELDLPSTTASLDDKLQWLQASIVERRRQEQNIVLAIDDAHQLDDDTLTQLLSYANAQSEHLLQVLLIGQPELENRLQMIARSLEIDGGRYYRLSQLENNEIPNYITQQLRAAGYQGNTIFTPKAIELLASYCEGSIHTLSLLCDASLLIAYLQSARQITVEIVEEAAQQQSLSSAEQSAVEPEPDPVDEPVAPPEPVDEQSADQIADCEPVQIDTEADDNSRLRRYLLLVAGLAVALISGALLIALQLAGNSLPPSAAMTPALTPPGTSTVTPQVTATTTTPESPPVVADSDPAPTPSPATQGSAMRNRPPVPDRMTGHDTPVTAMPAPHLAPPSAGAITLPNAMDYTVDNPQVRQLLRKATRQIRAQQLLIPVGDNALETYLEILKLDPHQTIALKGINQLNQYFFEQVTTAQRTKELLYQEAAAARAEQQRYLNQFSIAKKEKERYLRELNAYYLSQAIVANQQKVDSLIQAEMARQNTLDFLNRLTRKIPTIETDRQLAGDTADRQTPFVDTQQQQIQSESRVDRLLARAQQQINARRLVNPSRDSALTTFRKVLSLDPGNENALAGLEYIMLQYLEWAESSAALGHTKRAEKYFEQALEIDPNNLNLMQRVREVRQQVTIAQNAILGDSDTKEYSSRQRNLSSTSEIVEALIQSARIGDLQSVTRLLSSGASANDKDMRGETVLMIAAANNHLDIVRKLLQRGAKVNNQNSFNETALMLAARNGHSEVVSTLLQAGASPHSKDADGQTALIGAASKGHTSVAKQLLDNNAEPDTKTKSGRTALMAAAWNGHLDMVKLLLKFNSALDITNNDGWTALTHAAWQGHTDIVKYMLARGVNTAIRNNDGLTALAIASHRGHQRIVELLQ